MRESGRGPEGAVRRREEPGGGSHAPPHGTAPRSTVAGRGKGGRASRAPPDSPPPYTPPLMAAAGPAKALPGPGVRRLLSPIRQQ